MVKTRNGKTTAEWVGKGNKKRTAPVVEKPDGSRAVRLERKIWLARFRDPDGFVVERSTGCSNKSAASVKLNEFVKESERIAAGVMSKSETELADWRHSNLSQSINDYCDYVNKRSTDYRPYPEWAEFWR